MMPITTRAARLLLTSSLLLVPLTSAHVMMNFPGPRVQSDYLYDGECSGGGKCAQACGHPADDPNSPLTELQVDTPIDLEWSASIPHSPYKYRISLNRQGDGDNHFDQEENLLTFVDNSDGSVNPSYSGSFSASVTIPKEFMENCSDPENPCAMQLWDLYYFVSCANVVLVDNRQGNDGSGETTEALESGNNEDASDSGNEGNSDSSNSNNNEDEDETEEGGEEVDLYPNATQINGTWFEHSITLMDDSDDTRGHGLCPDIGGTGSLENGNLTCDIVTVGPCKPDGMDTSFGYTDNEDMPAIYSAHYGGYFIDSDGQVRTEECGELQTNFRGSGCLTALSGETGTNTTINFSPGTPVRFYECRNYPEQRFLYTTSGKFKLEQMDQPGTYLCLGMEKEGDRALSLMSCNTNGTDVSQITWKVEPEPSYMLDDGPMPMLEDMMDMTTEVEKKSLRGSIPADEEFGW